MTIQFRQARLGGTNVSMTNAQPGDLLVVRTERSTVGGEAYAAPSSHTGWTVVASQRWDTADYYFRWFSRTVQAGEDLNYVFSNCDVVQGIAYYDDAGDTPAIVPAASSYYSTWGVVSSTQVTAPSVTMPQPGLILGWFAIAGATLAAPSGMTERNSALTSSNHRRLFADQAVSAGSTGSKTANGTDSNRRAAGLFAITPANVAPNAPVLVSPADGATIDRNSTNRLDWSFSDPDAGDSQSKFDLRYRVTGAATWTTVTQTTPTTHWEASSGTFSANDYEWQVRTYDAQGVLGPYSASGFFTATDAPPEPTITYPVNGATVGQSETVEWSSPNQDAYQLQVLDAADVVVEDSGEVASSTARTRVVEFPINAVSRQVRARVKHGGLWSAWYTVTVSVSWTAPAAPSVSLLPDPGSGALVVTATNPTPAGDQPPVNYNDIYIDDGGGEFRAATLVTPNSSWTYWLPKSGRDYAGSVRVVAVGDNGTTASS